MTRLTIIAALGRNRVIGNGNALPWRLHTDLARFKAITLGRPIVMGRRTFEAIGRPLPGRTCIVVSRRALSVPAGVRTASSIEEALAIAASVAAATDTREIIIGGGGEIYAATLARADRLRLTEVDAAPPGDALFPDFPRDEFEETWSQSHPAGPRDDHAFRFVDYERCRLPDIDGGPDKPHLQGNPA